MRDLMQTLRVLVVFLTWLAGVIVFLWVLRTL